MAKQEVRRQFSVAVDGKTYECERIVKGTRVFYQEIHVIGVGLKTDSARYGSPSKGHPVNSMTGIARIIACEIIKESNAR